MKLGYILYLFLSAELSAGQSFSKLRSSSFGVAGQNQTFDYVACSIHSPASLAWKSSLTQLSISIDCGRWTGWPSSGYATLGKWEVLRRSTPVQTKNIHLIKTLRLIVSQLLLVRFYSKLEYIHI